MRILVTGGAGFIGRRVVTALVGAGHEVRVVDALLPEAHPDGTPPPMPDGVEFVPGDLRDPATVEAVLRGVDLVSHQAAVVGRGREILDARRHVGCNDLGTATLLAAMAEADIGRLVLAGSVVIYGASRYRCPEHGRTRPAGREPHDLAAGRFAPVCGRCGGVVEAEPVTEDDVPDPPRNMYAVTKLAQELLVDAWAVQTGGSAVSLRYHNVYGPDMPYASPYSGVAATFRSAVVAGVAPRVYEDGAPRRDFVHVDDIVSANVAALRRSEAGLRTYNVASGDPRTILEVATVLAAAGGGPPPVVTGEYRVGDVREIVASPRRIMAELGWTPTVGFADGMAAFAVAPMRGRTPVEDACR
ncbi:NAD-dependent epimerase/dehydratase family protein [Solwaraspora sp. WMMD791]|uniref:NAD-dependent epimerase/dehydratase family protein n=1 Tax=Solwaraspora sp. WMMD791 TaxID=3016086 RepID=UPI00249C154B|nr:NAD-dependent epimerase/dehydratase family protein [Solwaraspora sp. WMMD791]WFE29220.1 NAD-dependent epimerase/dehydratase family protein [Solwaraspora sp. WMMD791]